ncbi:type II toxin-antitoxin system RelE/ParE family toxin [Massilia sp. W12]|uniref:type II toxin-antitoxin system RelE/ParE family toxin n=1 Tax=Massilia sp. W12 TaxID=3126507 RepID=UPI0030CFB7C0
MAYRQFSHKPSGQTWRACMIFWRAAINIFKKLSHAPQGQLQHPRIGEQLHQFSPREVRRLLLTEYEIRYAIQAQTIYVLRIWHTREAH